MQRFLYRASIGRTTIVVSHRMSAIKNADRILFIDAGRIVEDGTHKELIALKGKYYEMIKPTYHALENANESKCVEGQQESIDEGDGEQRKVCSDFCQRKFQQDSHPLENKSSSTVAFWMSFKRILKLLRPDWVILSIAVCSSIVLGTTFPLFALIFDEAIQVSSRDILLRSIKRRAICKSGLFIHERCYGTQIMMKL